MKRSEFLKILGIGVAAAVIAPAILLEETLPEGLELGEGLRKEIDKRANIVILKDTYKVTGSQMTNRIWNGDNWCIKAEKNAMERYQKEREFAWFETGHNSKSNL